MDGSSPGITTITPPTQHVVIFIIFLPRFRRARAPHVRADERPPGGGGGPGAVLNCTYCTVNTGVSVYFKYRGIPWLIFAQNL